MTALLTGWVAAALGVVGVAAVWRVLTLRMDAVARACHELRGPLTAARLGLQLGSRRGELSPTRLQAIDLELGRAALALDDLAGAGVAPYAAAAVDVHALAADSVEAWACVAATRGVRLRLAPPAGRGAAVVGGLGGGTAVVGAPAGGATVLGDRFRLAQALGNLIANAIEHGGGSVEVSCSVAGGIARVEVVDGGPGLPAPVADLAGRSARRRRRRRRERLRTGHGHGLAVALAVAEAHGGRLAAAPADRGARVVLEFPVAARATPA
ncbi:MAG TPA: HAMP domain-containing sensor histidine kinase [Solirubrobacteraceae bacterium]|jgi:signal transduction histidine kinase